MTDAGEGPHRERLILCFDELLEDRDARARRDDPVLPESRITNDTSSERTAASGTTQPAWLAPMSPVSLGTAIVSPDAPEPTRDVRPKVDAGKRVYRTFIDQHFQVHALGNEGLHRREVRSARP